jgi:hypothetical protein
MANTPTLEDGTMIELALVLRTLSGRIGLAIGLTLVAFSAQAQTVSISPLTSSATEGAIFSVDVIGTGFPTTQGGGFSMTFDPLVLEVTNVSIDDVVWDFVNSTGTIDNIAGTLVDVNVSAFPGVATGSFTVATVEFTAKAAGSSELGMSQSSNPWASSGSAINPTFDQAATATVSGLQDPCTPLGVDTDADGIDDACDNCTLAFNPAQIDTDADGCGNQCDADFTQDGIVGAGDFFWLGQAYGSLVPPANPNLDIGPDPLDGAIGADDFYSLAVSFGGAPGPSGTTSGTTACP